MPRASRPSTGFFRHARINPRPIIGLTTNCPVDEEIFASLDFLADIPDVGREYLKKRGLDSQKVDKGFELFKSFVRQSKTFYQSATNLHFRASPLNYYYAFLNLAKALICISDPDEVDQRISHGLQHAHNVGALQEQHIASRSGVFAKLYELMIGQQIPEGYRLSIATLLSYSTDISHEFSLTGFGERSILPAMFRIQSADVGTHATLAIPRFELVERRVEMLQELLTSYEEVDFEKEIAREQFGLFAEQKKRFRFFETRKQYPHEGNNNDVIPVPVIVRECRMALHNYYQSNPYKDDYCDFYLCLPLDNPRLPFNEILAIYGVMYYLGSLIRYFPRYLEGILASKDAWIIERFVKSAPVTFLRHISNLILNEDRVYSSR